MVSLEPQVAGTRRTWIARWLNWIERIGNRLPDPVTLFAVGALLVLFGSAVAEALGWQAVNPATNELVKARSLLSPEGLRWVWLHLVENFTAFPPLGVVLVAMIGIGVAEHAGLIGALLKSVVVVTPQKLLTPAVVFVGVMSSMAADAGYVVLPPLAAAVFAQAGRSPIVGLCAVFAGVASGFSANLFITGLDPLLQSFTQQAARILQPDYVVDVRCNYYFMIASTIVMTLTGWAVTHWLVEPRFTPEEVGEQIRYAESQGVASATGGTGLSREERRGLLAAVLTLLAGSALIVWMVFSPNGALSGKVEKRPGVFTDVWVDAIVPILFFLFLLPGIAYGIAAGTIRSDRDVARMMNKTMAGMGSYVVMAFFAAQFISWFNESNLGKLVALEGVELLRQWRLPVPLLLVAVILLTTVLNLFIGSASAKWALLSTVFVPIFAGMGIRPELTQAAYRVGDSVTNSIAPLNPYMVIILLYLEKLKPRAGIGTLIAAMLPYAACFLVVWTLLLLGWVAAGLPLGPGDAAAVAGALPVQ
ncbi:MAG: aminobenzoyl-glutamate transporter [Pirellulaceae bacterium]|nr:MAG: aminobenzoyl-glutamate transporter [Pirellulaceae bacterium]